MTHEQININLQSVREQLIGKLIDNKALVDGKSVVPVSLTPYTISASRYTDLSRQCENVCSAIEKLLRHYVENSEFQQKFSELANYVDLSCIVPIYEHWVHLARFDIIESITGEFKLLETNCDCPGGTAFTPILKDIYQQLPVCPLNNGSDIVAQPIDHASTFIQSLVDIYQDIHVDNLSPNIVFVSSRYKPITNELDLFEKIAKNMGLNAQHAKVQDLEFKNGKVFHNDMPVDLVYQKFDAMIGVDNKMEYCIYHNAENEVNGYLRGIRERKLLTFNSFPAIFVGENKKILALLQDSKYQELFSKEEKNAIKSLCPATFILDSGDNKLEDKISDIKKYKDKYVIKRVIDTRARGVFIGKIYSQNKWNEITNMAIDGPFVVQEFVESRTNKVRDHQTLELKDMYNTLALFMIKGRASGLFVRSSEEMISNVVGKSGCLRPSYILK